MPENNLNRPVTIAFDGPHRAGKGTQCLKLSSTLSRWGLNSLIVRGDGTREGLGLTPGDPFSRKWQDRNKYIKSGAGGSVEDWNASSFILLQELSVVLEQSKSMNVHAVIIDRTILSRAAFLLHRGVSMVGVRMSLDDLYPDNRKLPCDTQLNLHELVPDVIFELNAPSPQNLLDRLDMDDPKYVFRSRNIKGGFESALRARQHIPEIYERRVTVLDGMDSPENIHAKVLATLGRTSIGGSADLSHLIYDPQPELNFNTEN